MLWCGCKKVTSSGKYLTSCGQDEGKLGLDKNLKIDTFNTAIPPTPAPHSTRAAPTRRRIARRECSSDEECEEALCAPAVPMAPSLASGRSRRASKTVAMSRMSTKTPPIEFTYEAVGEESDVTLQDTSDEAREE